MKRVNLLEALTDNIAVDADKCVYCGTCVDVCVMDNLRMKLAPCRAACPLKANCQGYVRLIGRGDDDKALSVLLETVPFPGVLGRICSRPCEDACRLGQLTGEPVAARDLKRYLAGRAEAGGLPLPEIAPPSGKSVAVVGAGPAGLTAAFDLLAKGHAVTVFDSAPEPGGMLRWALPSFKLPASVLAAEVGRVARMGARFEMNRALGPDMPLARLRDGHDAVVLALGCGGHARLGCDGEDLPGVVHGLPFLASARSGSPPALSGKTVIVGGGNVAVDAARTALRLGASPVTLVSLEEEGELPAFSEDIEAARSEGVIFLHGFGPARIGARNGEAASVILHRCLGLVDEGGRFRPRFDSCEARILDAANIIVAIGQRAAAECLAGSCLEGFAPGDADPVTLQSSDEKIFLAGDFVSGPSSAVQAMASGREAAESADRYVRGEHLRFGRTYAGPVETGFEIDASRLSDTPRAKPPSRSWSGAGDFSETLGALPEAEARREASRCLSCGGPHGKYRTCWFCLPCEVECPEEALYVEIPYLLR